VLAALLVQLVGYSSGCTCLHELCPNTVYTSWYLGDVARGKRDFPRKTLLFVAVARFVSLIEPFF